jgi:hypothetical protein
VVKEVPYRKATIRTLVHDDANLVTRVMVFDAVRSYGLLGSPVGIVPISLPIAVSQTPYERKPDQDGYRLYLRCDQTIYMEPVCKSAN